MRRSATCKHHCPHFLTISYCRISLILNLCGVDEGWGRLLPSKVVFPAWLRVTVRTS
ncbi:hypothetical protein ACFP2T_39390 [Plantactinospora solaniradicis]|uniref:Uncharacterized protein n=1 Tax=Plantactinospora solaniradicis TaxID=1723736 RepID=A0ABW1KKY3_9ACTN